MDKSCDFAYEIVTKVLHLSIWKLNNYGPQTICVQFFLLNKKNVNAKTNKTNYMNQ